MANPLNIPAEFWEWLEVVHNEAHEVVTVLIHVDRDKAEVRCRTELGKRYKRKYSLRWKVSEDYRTKESQ